MKLKVLVLIFALSFLAKSAICQKSESKKKYFNRLEKFVALQMDSMNIPGASIVFFEGKKICYHKNLGYANREKKEPVNDQTLFDAGSLSKTAFTYLVMKMVSEGKLELDKPLYLYLPNTDLTHDERYKLITARMVLSHSSGLPNWRRFNPDKKLDIKFLPGTQYLYSGEGFEYLAEVVASIYNVPKNDIQQIYEKEIASPLGVKNAKWTWNSYIEQHQAQGYFENKPAPGWGINKSNPNFYASYSLQTEAVSYAKLLIGLFSGEYLSEKAKVDFLKRHTNTIEKDSSFYCLGVKIKPSLAGDIYYHSGYNKNFYCAYLYSKEYDKGYVFFINADNGNAFDKKLESYFLNNIKNKI